MNLSYEIKIRKNITHEQNVNTHHLPLTLLPEKTEYIRMTAKLKFNGFLFGCAILGALPVGLILLALINITTGQLADPEFLWEVATESEVITTILLTFYAGFWAVLILLAVGTPLAYLLARTNSKTSRVIGTIIDLPVMLPHTIAGILVYLLFMPNGWLGAPLSAVGVAFEDAFLGIVIAMLFVATPFYVNTVQEGFAKVPVHLENAARTLGASPFTVFRTITLPLTARHISSGSVLAWGRGISEFSAIIMIAYYPMVISTLIYNRFMTGGLKESSAVAFTMIIACLLIFGVLRFAAGKIGENYDRV